MNVYYIAGVPISDELYHHGVLGQEWGKRNGPPYPLSDKEHSAREKKAGWRNSLDKENGDNFGLTDSQKKYILAGAAAVGAMYLEYRYGAISSTARSLNDLANFDPSSAFLEAYFNYGKSAKGDSEIPNGKLSKLIEERKRYGEIDKKTGLYVNHDSENIESNCSKINPDFSFSNSKTSENCGLCSVAYDMRRRGYDVYAGYSDTGINRQDVRDLYRGARRVGRAGDHVSGTINGREGLNQIAAERVVRSFSREKNTRGILFVGWSFSRGAHAMSYEVDKNGNLLIIDSQVNRIYKGNNAIRLLMQTCSVESYRTDNLVPNIKEMINNNIIK